MSTGMQSTEQKFQFPKEVVLEALKVVLPSIGIQPVKVDMYIGRVDASVGASAFSWGERISIAVDDIDHGSCVARIESSLKVGGNFAGAGRHHKNFSNIIFALSEYLQSAEKGELKTNRQKLDEEINRKSGTSSSVTSIVWIVLAVAVVSYFILV
ncbi:hypothetical protein NJH54_05605 [Pseudomonas asiatica]|uniref:hypothetical protein n=1 Tax=Pseudomonas TaxID=286 RepID=UPI000C7D4B2D|nr:MULTISPECIES: hypothetical protein [Pseudomonas]MCE0757301.1 hypothetical protein [Pseudomonas asiatica]MCE1032843.1 hypothetical protein [Pseudomonas asiatica]MCO7523986.1 hypothetical protein [Pseudomonas asiatica]MDM3874042.1 hypothetical protein [Pseudomonas asiatica]PLP87549.1 hypothetical protein CX682_23785 [Pseudomonas sp. FFUP_PS_41]